MRTTSIGSLEISAVGLGCNNFGTRADATATNATVMAALESGINFFDTADVYGEGASEELLGRALKGHRDEAVVATKFGGKMPDGSGASPEWVQRACDDSLRRLQMDHIDLYQLHRPDPEVPIEDTLGALDELVQAGKVREIGHSNLDGEQLAEADRIATSGAAPHTRFVTAQNHWSLLTPVPEEGLLDAARAHGVKVLPYFPLESGLLTGKYAGGKLPDGTRLASIPEDRRERFLTDERLEATERLTAWAHEHDHTLLDLAISWLASHEICASVIAGATSPDQARQNAAAGEWPLTPFELAEVARVAGREHNLPGDRRD